ncbi:hypothetical protein SNEBB_002877 [Seison nebaliae]|nr:hypothetical protein SNEBB_002877 [Seison nebaliae]
MEEDLAELHEEIDLIRYDEFSLKNPVLQEDLIFKKHQEFFEKIMCQTDQTRRVILIDFKWIMDRIVMDIREELKKNENKSIAKLLHNNNDHYEYLRNNESIMTNIEWILEKIHEQDVRLVLKLHELEENYPNKFKIEIEEVQKLLAKFNHYRPNDDVEVENNERTIQMNILFDPSLRNSLDVKQKSRKQLENLEMKQKTKFIPIDWKKSIERRLIESLSLNDELKLKEEKLRDEKIIKKSFKRFLHQLCRGQDIYAENLRRRIKYLSDEKKQIVLSEEFEKWKKDDRNHLVTNEVPNEINLDFDDSIIAIEYNQLLVLLKKELTPITMSGNRDIFFQYVFNYLIVKFSKIKKFIGKIFEEILKQFCILFKLFFILKLPKRIIELNENENEEETILFDEEIDSNKFMVNYHQVDVMTTIMRRNAMRYRKREKFIGEENEKDFQENPDGLSMIYLKYFNLFQSTHKHSSIEHDYERIIDFFETLIDNHYIDQLDNHMTIIYISTIIYRYFTYVTEKNDENIFYQKISNQSINDKELDDVMKLNVKVSSFTLNQQQFHLSLNYSLSPNLKDFEKILHLYQKKKLTITMELLRLFCEYFILINGTINRTSGRRVKEHKTKLYEFIVRVAEFLNVERAL